jgi:hypothetical protein
MQPILDHIADTVRPVLRKYMAAERTLTDALDSNDAAAIAAARQDVRLAGRQAVDLLHHLADFVLKEPTPRLSFADISAVRAAVGAQCVYARGADPIDDLGLLRDVADAFKHHRPDRKSQVDVSTAVTPIGSGFGMMRYGEGKFGGAEQIVITTVTGDKRALSSVLQNVFDAWMTLLGQPLPPISQY